MKQVAISEFKAKCIGLLKSAERSGKGFIVTLRGKPLVRVEPIPPAPTAHRLGGLRGSLQIHGDIVNTGFASDWDTED
jgi:antitoxin (DNA-binding transcriptional repressor) of toxin-antitoxin stability system